MGRTFSVVFLALSLLLMGLASYQFVDGLKTGKELISIFVQSVNTGIIALAIFELGIGIGKEYATTEQHEHTFYTVRRMIARFVGTVCIALVLESLIMIIKYSQLDLAGNLNYPVGILAASSFMLCALGLFLHFSRDDCEIHGRLAREQYLRNQPAHPVAGEHPQQRSRNKPASSRRA
jgi:hypothetical protein